MIRARNSKQKRAKDPRPLSPTEAEDKGAAVEVVDKEEATSRETTMNRGRRGSHTIEITRRVRQLRLASSRLLHSTMPIVGLKKMQKNPHNKSPRSKSSLM